MEEVGNRQMAKLESKIRTEISLAVKSPNWDSYEPTLDSSVKSLELEK
jgi:hypothetical protein